jgi:hypothetical protein
MNRRAIDPIAAVIDRSRDEAHFTGLNRTPSSLNRNA